MPTNIHQVEHPTKKLEKVTIERVESLPEKSHEHIQIPEKNRDVEQTETTKRKTKTIFLTGTTGFLGSHTAAELLRGGHKMVLLARENHGKTASQRVEESLKKIVTQEEYDKFSNSIEVVEGNIEEENLGLTPEQLKNIADDQIEVLHTAANLSFAKENRDKIIATNVGGTRNVLDFASKVGAKKFNFVSTAYVCGKKTGVTEETLASNQNPEFHNPYEESKYLAEQEIEVWQRETNTPTTIFRPSIIIEREQTDNHSGYYAFASAFALLRQKITMMDGKLEFPCNPDVPLDLISVDDVAKYTAQVLEKEPIDGTIEVLHMTNPNSRTVGEIFRDSLDLMGLGRKVELVNNENLVNPDFYKVAPSQETSKELVRILRDLMPYLFSNIEFSTENITKKLESYNPESISEEFLREVLKYKYTPDAPDERRRTRREANFIPPEYADREIQTTATEQKAINVALKVFEKAVSIILRPSGIEDVQQLYSREAENYDFKHHLTTAYNNSVLRKDVANDVRGILTVRRDNTEGVSILDLASGTGLTIEAISKILPKSLPGVELYGLDMTEKMIEVGQKRLGRKTEIQLVKGDAMNFISSEKGIMPDSSIKFKPDSFDFITSVFGIGGIENSVKCFEQQLSGLKEGGIAIMIDIHKPSLKPEDIKMPFGIPASAGFIKQAWEKTIKPIVLQKLWRWKDPTVNFYKMPLVAIHDEEKDKYFGFEVVKREVKNMKWWFGLPVMTVAKLTVKKIPISREEFLIKQSILG